MRVSSLALSIEEKSLSRSVASEVETPVSLQIEWGSRLRIDEPVAQHSYTLPFHDAHPRVILALLIVLALSPHQEVRYPTRGPHYYAAEAEIWLHSHSLDLSISFDAYRTWT
jgi:hypothetical protein